MTDVVGPIDVLGMIDWMAEQIPFKGMELCKRFASTRSAIVDLMEASNDVLDGSKIIQINFADSDFYSVKKDRLDALQESLTRFGSTV